jgi:hypothetical protein
MTKLANATDCSRRRVIVYWTTTTAIFGTEFAAGGHLHRPRGRLLAPALAGVPRPGEPAREAMYMNQR